MHILFLHLLITQLKIFGSHTFAFYTVKLPGPHEISLCRDIVGLLFELDMSLMRLREGHGETDEAVSLTGTYHNLLRMWADT